MSGLCARSAFFSAASARRRHFSMRSIRRRWRPAGAEAMRHFTSSGRKPPPRSWGNVRYWGVRQSLLLALGGHHARPSTSLTVEVTPPRRAARCAQAKPSARTPNAARRAAGRGFGRSDAGASTSDHNPSLRRPRRRQPAGPSAFRGPFMALTLLLIKSAGVGLAVAAPVGPMSLLCMRRTLTEGWRRGLATGAGIAVGDGLYAAVAALGLAGVTAFANANQSMLHLAAGLFLLWLGLATFRRRENEAAVLAAPSTVAAFWQSILLTLTNP